MMIIAAWSPTPYAACGNHNKDCFNAAARMRLACLRSRGGFSLDASLLVDGPGRRARIGHEEIAVVFVLDGQRLGSTNDMRQRHENMATRTKLPSEQTTMLQTNIISLFARGDQIGVDSLQFRPSHEVLL
jgi:hypothetical protein